MSDLPPGYSQDELKSFVKKLMRDKLKPTRYKAKQRNCKIFRDSDCKALYSEDGYHDTHVEVWAFISKAGRAKHMGIRRVIYDYLPLKPGERVAKITAVRWGEFVSGGSHRDLDLFGSM